MFLHKWMKSQSILSVDSERSRTIGEPTKHEKSNACRQNKAYKSSINPCSDNGPTQWKVAPVYSTDGTTLTKENHNIPQCWDKYFWQLLNRINPSDPSALEELPTLPQVLNSMNVPLSKRFVLPSKLWRTRNLQLKIQYLERYLYMEATTYPSTHWILYPWETQNSFGGWLEDFNNWRA